MDEEISRRLAKVYTILLSEAEKGKNEMDEIKEGELYWKQETAKAETMAKKNATVECWQGDSKALYTMIDAICTYENRRVWWEITDRWLKAHHQLLIDDPKKGKTA
jgi:hypothetical protein